MFRLIFSEEKDYEFQFPLALLLREETDTELGLICRILINDLGVDSQYILGDAFFTMFKGHFARNSSLNAGYDSP